MGPCQRQALYFVCGWHMLPPVGPRQRQALYFCVWLEHATACGPTSAPGPLLLSVAGTCYILWAHVSTRPSTFVCGWHMLQPVGPRPYMLFYICCDQRPVDCGNILQEMQSGRLEAWAQATACGHTHKLQCVGTCYSLWAHAGRSAEGLGTSCLGVWGVWGHQTVFKLQLFSVRNLLRTALCIVGQKTFLIFFDEICGPWL